MKFKKLYTKSGDEGKTSLWTGERVDKTDIRIEAVGLFDELNAVLGMAYSFSNKSTIHESFRDHTSEVLTNLMGEIVSDKKCFKNEYLDNLNDLYYTLADSLDNSDEINGWVQYGKNTHGCNFYDWATTIARKCELTLWKLKNAGIEVSGDCYKYMNQFSKVLFLLGRKEF